MEIRFDHEIPPPPEGGRAFLEWQREVGPLWAMTDIDDWTVAVQIAQKEDKLVVGEMRVFPAEDSQEMSWSQSPSSIPGSGITATLVRSIRLGEFIGEAFARLTTPDLSTIDDAEDWYDLVTLGGFDPETLTEATETQRRGRPPLPDPFLAKVSALYAKAVEDDQPAPVSFVAEQIHDPNVERVRQVISKCRERGFLTPAPAKGIAGGQPTQKTVDLLREMKADHQQEGDE